MLCRRTQDRAAKVAGSYLSTVVYAAVIMAASGAANAANALRPVSDWEGRRANSILLNGDWEFASGDGSEQAETPEGASRLRWQAVRLPGPFLPWSREAATQTKIIWARRNFKATPAQAESMAVLHWNRIACGAAAFLNGQKVGENEPTGPFQVIAPAGVLRPGDNQIVLRIRGAAGVPKSRSGHALIPAGFGVGMPEVTDDVWMDLADAAYMKWVLALPDLAGSRVKIRVTPTGRERLDNLEIIAQVKSWPDGKVMGEGRSPARLTPNPDPLGGEHFFVEVPMPGFRPWTYEAPHLHTAEVTLRRGDKVLDAVAVRFGMREITIADGHYLLNGKTLRLRGSELVFEWNWGDTITGKDDKDADALACAQIGAEHTEAMRRARIDGMLPYMYAGWTRTRQAARVRETGKGSAVWKAGYASPLSACWHSSLSPVLASLDLFDPDYLPGQQVCTDLFLINDSWHDATIHVDLLLTDECPEFIPEAVCFDRPVTKWSYDFMLQADALTKHPITWKLPEREGSYWLTARTTGLPGRPVLSQRFVRAVRQAEVPADLVARRFVVLGGDAAADAWFRAHKLQVGQSLEKLVPGQDVVVIWDAARLAVDAKRQAGILGEFAVAGGRVVVLATRSWDWTELCDIKVSNIRGSRVFPYPDAKSSMLGGIQPEWLIRWNGLPGTVVAGSLDGPALATARKILWVREPKTCVAAEVPTADGRGTILFSQLDVQRHVNRLTPNYDPAAEQVLINMLRGTQPKEER